MPPGHRLRLRPAPAGVRISILVCRGRIGDRGECFTPKLLTAWRAEPPRPGEHFLRDDGNQPTDAANERNGAESADQPTARPLCRGNLVVPFARRLAPAERVTIHPTRPLTTISIADSHGE